VNEIIAQIRIGVIQKTVDDLLGSADVKEASYEIVKDKETHERQGIAGHATEVENT